MDIANGISIEKNAKVKGATGKLLHLIEEKDLEIKRLKQKNSLLKQENNLLREIFDNLPNRIFCKDVKGGYLLSNNPDIKLNRMYAMKQVKDLDNFSGKTDEEIFPANLAKLFRDSDLEVISTGKKLVMERQRFNEEEQPIIELVTKIPLYNSQGQIIALLSYCMDITYLKSLEAKVEHADKAQIEFIHHMQHDIKTPFTGITGLTQILLDCEKDSGKRELLRDITLSANELMEYCDRILDFSKATAKNLPLAPLTFQLHDMVDSVINMVFPVVKIKQLTLLLNYVDPLPKTVIGYPHRLRSILVNLLNNALQYTQQGQIRLIVQAKTRINNSLSIQFIIKDTGQGMSAEKRIAIEKQLNDAPTIENDTYEGRGLGLRIVSQFAKDIGAKVSIVSELGMGTTFTIESPLEISQG